MYVEKIYNDALLPIKAHQSDAGYDVHSYEDYIIKPKQRVTIHTGIKIKPILDMPQDGFNVYTQVAPRSGLAVKQGVDVLAGIIDNSYRGEVMVCLLNTSTKQIKITKGDRIAQLIPIICLTGEVIETKLEDTDRGDKGFGSSGK